jgi:peptidoglycan/LPS O-acetylase OafA/YrhL
LFLVSTLLSAVNGYQFIGTVSGTVFLGASVILITILVKGYVVWSRVSDAELGGLLYAVYLNHYVVLLVFSAFEASGVLAWLFAFLAVILISFVLNRVLEKPLRKIRKRVREEPDRRSR